MMKQKKTPAHNLRLESTSSTARSGRASRKPSGRPSWSRPEGYRAPPGGGTASRSRICSQTSGAARRFLICSRHRTSEKHRPTGSRRRRRSGQRDLGVGEQGTRGTARSFGGEGKMARRGGRGGLSFVFSSLHSLISHTLFFISHFSFLFTRHLVG